MVLQRDSNDFVMRDLNGFATCDSNGFATHNSNGFANALQMVLQRRSNGFQQQGLFFIIQSSKFKALIF